MACRRLRRKGLIDMVVCTQQLHTCTTFVQFPEAIANTRPNRLLSNGLSPWAPQGQGLRLDYSPARLGSNGVQGCPSYPKLCWTVESPASFHFLSSFVLIRSSRFTLVRLRPPGWIIRIASHQRDLVTTQSLFSLKPFRMTFPNMQKFGCKLFAI